jgi:hypothetical protein
MAMLAKIVQGGAFHTRGVVPPTHEGVGKGKVVKEMTEADYERERNELANQPKQRTVLTMLSPPPTGDFRSVLKHRFVFYIPTIFTIIIQSLQSQIFELLVILSNMLQTK